MLGAILNDSFNIYIYLKFLFLLKYTETLRRLNIQLENGQKSLIDEKILSFTKSFYLFNFYRISLNIIYNLYHS